MPSLGPAEILVILVVALLVFGPDKMPEIGRQLARAVREFRRVQKHVTSELHGVVSELDFTSDQAPAGGDPVPSLPPKDGAPAVDGQEPPKAGPVPRDAPDAPGSTVDPGPSP